MEFVGCVRYDRPVEGPQSVMVKDFQYVEMEVFRALAYGCHVIGVRPIVGYKILDQKDCWLKKVLPH